MAKPNIRKQITEAKAALKSVMKDNLSLIGVSLIDQISRRMDKLPDSKRFDAIGALEPKGVLGYKQEMLKALAVVAYDALKAARKEVPRKSNIKLMEDEDTLQLGEWEKLPSKVRARLQRTVNTIIDKNIADITASLKFQFQHSIDSTDSKQLILGDLTEGLEDWIAGAAIEAGSSTLASQTINEARSAFFFDDEVLAEVEAFEFVNGDPVSPICQDLAGTVFRADDPGFARYTPPLHFNCKSYIVPILKGGLGKKEITKLRPSSKSLEASIQFGEHFCCEEHQTFKDEL